MSKLRCGAKRKFIVFKTEDLEKLPYSTSEELNGIAEGIRRIREEESRNPDPEYIVINTDVSYFEAIKTILQANGHWG